MKLEKKVHQNPNKKKNLFQLIKSLKFSVIGLIVAFLFGLFFLQINNFITQATDSLLAEIRLYQSNSLPTIFLDIPYESLFQLQTKRDEALENGILISSDEDFVPASIRYGENADDIDVKLRLKGDWTDHLKTDKWSLRIHIKEDSKSLFGMKKFSLQAPETRTFVHEWAFHQNLMDEGILTTNYLFVNVVLNGQHKGIYALEEGFTSDLLEAQERREGVIFRFNEDLLWNNRDLFFQDDYPYYYASESIGHFTQFSNILINEISPYQESRVSNIPELNEQMISAANLLNSFFEGTISADAVLDTELWGRFYAISDLWGAQHGTRWHNLRFYFNPITGLIEPVAYDSLALEDPDSEIQYFRFDESSALFLNDDVQKAYIQTLEKISSPDYLEQLEERYLQQSDVYLQALYKEYSPDETFPTLGPFPDALSLRANVLRTNLEPNLMVRGGFSVEQFDDQTWLTIELINLLIVPVEVEVVNFGKNIHYPEPEWCLYGDCQGGKFINNKLVLDSGFINNYQPVVLKIPIDQILDGNSSPHLTIQTKLYGGTITKTNTIMQISLPEEEIEALSPDISLEFALESHPFLTLSESKSIKVASGDWNVVGDLVIPDGYRLIIEADTILRFDEGSILLSSDPVNFLGEQEYPIILMPQNKTWGGIVVLNSGGESIWHNVVVEKTKGISRDGWKLTGGVTFFNSSIHMKNVVFSSSLAEDSLNIIRSKFLLEQTRFSNTASDGFDGDFVTGEITECWFKNIGGDGLDFSGSDVKIINNTFNSIGDKAISIGEQTNAELINIHILTTGIGVASKDLSTVFLDQVNIDNAKVAGLAVYIKKPTYGPSTLIAENTEIINSPTQVLRQTGSYLILNGIEIIETDLNIDILYP